MLGTIPALLIGGVTIGAVLASTVLTGTLTQQIIPFKLGLLSYAMVFWGVTYITTLVYQPVLYFTIPYVTPVLEIGASVSHQLLSAAVMIVAIVLVYKALKLLRIGRAFLPF